MRLAAFRRQDGGPQCGVVRGEEIVSLTGAGFPDLLSVIRGGDAAVSKIAEWLSRGPRLPLSSVRLLAPIPRPPKLLCIGLNYRDHAAETNVPVPSVPTVFAKFPTAIIGPGDSIVLPKSSSQPDYEAEFAFVIGKGGRHIPAERWAEHVFGYTMLNDVSARDYQKAVSQWTMGKNFDTFAPMGPYLVTRDEIADPHALDISLTLNGELMQSSNTRNLVFGVPDLIAFLSSVLTLEPGDVVSTGTPAGVGFVRRPPRYLQSGDETVVRVQGLGELRNPVAAE
jgi:2-keto-4-pentenoate hydratase/2-oxohepta-3-ene-1,7-dioic acid hydratase in catechol pathway